MDALAERLDKSSESGSRRRLILARRRIAEIIEVTDQDALGLVAVSCRRGGDLTPRQRDSAP